MHKLPAAARVDTVGTGATSSNIEVNLTDASTHQLALYLLDSDTQPG
jgi:hypothetical protein